MRMPLSKIYRAFPEFDPFPDAECERYIRYAYRQSRLRIGCIPIVAFVIALVVFVTLNSIVVYVLRSLAFQPSEAVFPVMALLMMVTAIAVPSIIALLVRDRVLKKVLLDRIRTARCPSCEFSLLGLPVAAGATRCPECGTHIVLSMHNLTPEDLLIRRVDERTEPLTDGDCPCGKCGESLLGAPIEGGRARCKVCGHVQLLTGPMLARALGYGRMPDGYVDAAARITVCPTCTKTLIGLPIFEGQARCMDCGFVASVVRRESDVLPTESASEVGLRIKRSREEGTQSEQSKQRGAEGSGVGEEGKEGGEC